MERESSIAVLSAVPSSCIKISEHGSGASKKTAVASSLTYSSSIPSASSSSSPSIARAAATAISSSSVVTSSTSTSGPSMATVVMSPLTELDGYQFIKTLGHGSYGKVELAYDYYNREKVAIKVIHKKQIKSERQQERLRREIRVLSLVKHPHIIELKKVIETRENIYLVMEYASDGELFDYIVYTRHIKESECIHFFRQILSALQYLHSHHVLHRDLKPENLLLTNGKQCLKLIDFGFTNIFGTGKLLDTFCGSPYYASPEMISGKNYIGPEVDIWSLGVILYILVTSKLPFDDTNTSDLFKKICSGKFPIPDFLSSSCIDLLKGMICPEPQYRYTIEQVSKHSWVNQGYHTSPNPFIPFRFPLNESRVNEAILDHLLKSGYSAMEIKSILFGENVHPLKSEYFLLLDSISQNNSYSNSDGVGMDNNNHIVNLMLVGKSNGHSERAEIPSWSAKFKSQSQGHPNRHLPYVRDRQQHPQSLAMAKMTTETSTVASRRATATYQREEKGQLDGNGVGLEKKRKPSGPPLFGPDSHNNDSDNAEKLKSVPGYRNRLSKVLFKWVSLFGGARKGSSGLFGRRRSEESMLGEHHGSLTLTVSSSSLAQPDRRSSAPNIIPQELNSDKDKVLPTPRRRFSMPAFRQLLHRNKSKSKVCALSCSAASASSSQRLASVPANLNFNNELSSHSYLNNGDDDINFAKPRLISTSQTTLNIKTTSYPSLQLAITQILKSKNILYRIEPFEPFIYHCEYQYKSSKLWNQWRRLGGGTDEPICKVNFIVEICQLTNTANAADRNETSDDVQNESHRVFGFMVRKLNGNFWSYRKLYHSLTSNFAQAISVA